MDKFHIPTPAATAEGHDSFSGAGRAVCRVGAVGAALPARRDSGRCGMAGLGGCILRMDAVQAAGLVSARAWRSRGCPYPRCECNGCGHHYMWDANPSGPCERPSKWRPAAFRHTPATSRRFYTPQIMARLRTRAPNSKVEHVSTGRHGRVAGCFPGGNRITRWLAISRRSAAGLPSGAGGLRTARHPQPLRKSASSAGYFCLLRISRAAEVPTA